MVSFQIIQLKTSLLFILNIIMSMVSQWIHNADNAQVVYISFWNTFSLFLCWI